MRYVSLFSGIEAATVAWDPLGWEPVAFCEVDPFPCAVLAHRWPNVPNLGDVTKIDWSGVIDEYGSPDVLVGGSPCQSFSVAGKRESLDGQSRLMYEYIRACDEVRSEWILWENVPGVLNTRDNAFKQLIDTLQNIGYVSIAWRVLDAQFFGVAQRRRRVFLVGHLGGGGGSSAAVLFEPESVCGNTSSSKQKREELARAAGNMPACGGFKFHQGARAGSIGYANEQSPTLVADWHNPAVMAFAQNTRDEVRMQGDGDMCGALAASPGMKQQTYVCALQSDGSTSMNGNGGGYNDDGSAYTVNLVDRQSVVCMASGQANAEIAQDGSCPTLTCLHEQPIVAGRDFVIRRLTPMECERLQGFPDGYTDIPYKGREHPSDGARYKALGNSFAVPVVRWIGERIEAVAELIGESERTPGRCPNEGSLVEIGGGKSFCTPWGRWTNCREVGHCTWDGVSEGADDESMPD